MSNVEIAIEDAITRISLESNGHFVVAFSGGGDSTALLTAVKRLTKVNPDKVCVAHFHHGIQQNVADEAVAHVSAVCNDFGFKLVVGRGDVPAFASENKLSTEMAGRQLRYEFLERVAREHDANFVLTGHTLNDQVETVLMNILRGSGIAGLSGMDFMSKICVANSEIKVVRPLLNLERRPCESYCNEHRINFLSDPSNSDMDFTRNKIRHQTLPFLEAMMNGTFGAIARLSDNVKQVRDYLQEDLAKCGVKPQVCPHGIVKIERKKFIAVRDALKPLLIRRMWKMAGQDSVVLAQTQMNRIIEAARLGGGKVLELPNNVRVRIEYETVLVIPNLADEVLCYGVAAPLKPLCLNVGKPVTVGYDCKIEAQYVKKAETSAKQPDKFSVLVAEEKLNGDLFVRRRRHGDTFVPLGKHSSVKLKDFFIKAHTPSYLRDYLPIIASGDQIVWVVGYCLSDKFKPESNSESVLRLSVSRDFFRGCVQAPHHQPIAE